MLGQLSLFEPDMPIYPGEEKRRPFTRSCYNCAFLNKNKKRITGTRNHLVQYGCKSGESGEIPGAVPIGKDYLLGSMACGLWLQK